MNKINTKTKYVIVLICGLFVGFINGFFGGGGGMLVIPLLTFLGLEEKNAHATALLCILPISVASAVVYIVKGNINYAELGFASLGFILGGIVGALLLKRTNNKVLRIIFSLIMIAVGIKILI